MLSSVRRPAARVSPSVSRRRRGKKAAPRNKNVRNDEKREIDHSRLEMNERHQMVSSVRRPAARFLPSVSRQRNGSEAAPRRKNVRQDGLYQIHVDVENRVDTRLDEKKKKKRRTL